MKFKKSIEYCNRAKEIIPAAGHTYSKGYDQFPQESPHAIKRGNGARVWDLDGNEFIDWGMGLTSVLFGHAYEPIICSIKKELDNGVNFIRPSYRELELAELFKKQIPCAEMVKFGKNGSDVTTAAIRLARAYTGKDLVLRCSDHPFFSQHDWFIGDTNCNAGIPKEVTQLTKGFKYDDIENFKEVVTKYKEQGISCAILQPATSENPSETYLKKLKEICEENNIVLIFDEIITGFRYHPKGAQFLYGVTPHLATFGKAMANGFSISALAGEKKIMELGGLEHDKEKVFLMSSTYGGEPHHLMAAIKSIELLNENDYEVTKHIWNVGKEIKESFNEISQSLGLLERARVDGLGCKPHFNFSDEGGNSCYKLRTFFQQEMIQEGVLVQGIVPSYAHRNEEISKTIAGMERSLDALRKAIDKGNVEEKIIGPMVKPVFRKYN